MSRRECWNVGGKAWRRWGKRLMEHSNLIAGVGEGEVLRAFVAWGVGSLGSAGHNVRPYLHVVARGWSDRVGSYLWPPPVISLQSDWNVGSETCAARNRNWIRTFQLNSPNWNNCTHLNHLIAKSRLYFDQNAVFRTRVSVQGSDLESKFHFRVPNRDLYFKEQWALKLRCPSSVRVSN